MPGPDLRKIYNTLLKQAGSQGGVYRQDSEGSFTPVKYFQPENEEGYIGDSEDSKLPVTDIEAKKPDWMRYESEFDAQNKGPKYDRNLNNPLMRKSKKLSLKNEAERIYGRDRSNYIAQQLLSANPQGNRDRVSWLNSFNPTEREKILSSEEGYQLQPSDFASAQAGATSHLNYLTGMDLQSPYVTKEEQDQRGVLNVFDVANVPGKAVRSLYRDQSLSDALQGKQADERNVGFIERGLTDLAGDALLGGSGKILQSKKLNLFPIKNVQKEFDRIHQLNKDLYFLNDMKQGYKKQMKSNEYKNRQFLKETRTDYRTTKEANPEISNLLNTIDLDISDNKYTTDYLRKTKNMQYKDYFAYVSNTKGIDVDEVINNKDKYLLDEDLINEWWSNEKKSYRGIRFGESDPRIQGLSEEEVSDLEKYMLTHKNESGSGGQAIGEGLYTSNGMYVPYRFTGYGQGKLGELELNIPEIDEAKGLKKLKKYFSKFPDVQVLDERGKLPQRGYWRFNPPELYNEYADKKGLYGLRRHYEGNSEMERTVKNNDYNKLLKMYKPSEEEVNAFRTKNFMSLTEYKKWDNLYRQKKNSLTSKIKDTPIRTQEKILDLKNKEDNILHNIRWNSYNKFLSETDPQHSVNRLNMKNRYEKAKKKLEQKEIEIQEKESSIKDTQKYIKTLESRYEKDKTNSVLLKTGLGLSFAGVMGNKAIEQSSEMGKIRKKDTEKKYINDKTLYDKTYDRVSKKGGKYLEEFIQSYPEAYKKHKNQKLNIKK